MKTVKRIYADSDVEHVETLNVQDWQFDEVVRDLRKKAARANADARKSGDPGRVKISVK